MRAHFDQSGDLWIDVDGGAIGTRFDPRIYQTVPKNVGTEVMQLVLQVNLTQYIREQITELTGAC